MILAGDIGGTKCNLALFAQHEVPLRPALQRRYATGDSGSLEQLIDQFFLECKTETGLTPAGKLTAAGFGVAGAVVDGRLVANNIPWELTAAGLGLDQLVPINDLVATAYGLPRLETQDFLMLNTGTPQKNGTQALIAAGTGLGQAMIFWDGRQHRASPSEGGAADFAPRTEREIGLLQFLKQRMPRVSCEEIFPVAASGNFTIPGPRRPSRDLPGTGRRLGERNHPQCSRGQLPRGLMRLARRPAIWLYREALPLHGKSPFLRVRFCRKLTLNMHQKMGCRSFFGVRLKRGRA